MIDNTKSGFSKHRAALYFSMLAMAIAAAAVSIIMLTTSAKLYSNFNSKMDNLQFVMLMLVALAVQMFLPLLVEKIFRIRISPLISFIFILQCFGGTFLGNVANLYYIVPLYNKFIHYLLGFSLSLIGLAGIQLFTEGKEALSPLFIALVVLFTGVSIGVFWEFFEFGVDLIFDMNMQSYASETGELLAGKAALLDTMLDLLVNTAGALTVAVLAFVSFKYKTGLHEYCRITKMPSKKRYRIAEENAELI